ncbi:MAG: patatin-like phospholipase family protein, partial [Terriglobales bacterium]
MSSPPPPARHGPPPASAAAHDAAQEYLPASKRAGVGLALSGGGFRATLFHLGALRRIHEYGLLPALDTVVGVSGGAIALAALAVGWPEGERPGAAAQPGGGRPSGGHPSSGQPWSFDRAIAAPLEWFTGGNIRTQPILGALLPWNWLRGQSNTDLLARQYRRLTRDRSLASLPARPRFCFAATDLAFGAGWRFERGRMGDWQAGYGAPAGGNAGLARAVAASSAFPPVFTPLAARLRPAQLTGGGVPP